MRRDLTPYHHSMPSDMRGSFPANFLENLFNNSFMAGFTSSMRSDIKETNQEFIVEVEMPGFSKENINVVCQDGQLTISAINMHNTDQEKASYVRQERQYGQISRSYRMDGIDEDRIIAEYRDGILRLTLPKSNDTNEKRRRIDIH
jgi:HSP20 family protein